MHQHSQNRVPRRRRELGSEKIFEEIIADDFPNIGKETFIKVQESVSTRQDKPKKEHAETHSNQSDKK